MTVQYYTYLYRDPKDGTPIYVGLGSKKRAWDHFKKSTNSHLQHLLNKRISEGYVFDPIINNETDLLTAKAMEKFWIDFYGRRDLGLGTLLNLTDGGDGTYNRICSTETRTKISSSLIGFKHTPESSKKKSEANLRRPPASEETRRKLSAANLGRPTGKKGMTYADIYGPDNAQAQIDKRNATKAAKKAAREANAKTYNQES